ncbi:MAG TPA: Ig-like domain-containing protein, partial [Blastocatellia bacterium]|nr:Ig-like domain-containing protein [Blastocatellia bacterium]
MPAQFGASMTGGLEMRLSEGTEQPVKREEIPAPRAAALSDADTQSVLSRLQPIKVDAGDEKDFALRDRSLPPPRTGKTIEASFPPPSSSTGSGTVATGPLEVVRHAPEGDVPIAPQLSVTFSQPMVAVTSHADSIASDVPVKISPQPAGQWRWVGTKTLLFEPEGRFPMSTEYAVTVPAGVKSATGASLVAAKSWKFNTPAPVVKSSYPDHSPQRRDAMMFVEFDQRVDPQAVLRTIR